MYVFSFQSTETKKKPLLYIQSFIFNKIYIYILIFTKWEILSMLESKESW